MWIQGFIVYIKTDNIYKDIEEDVETRFDTSNYELVQKLIVTYDGSEDKNAKGKKKKKVS